MAGLLDYLKEFYSGNPRKEQDSDMMRLGANLKSWRDNDSYPEAPFDAYKKHAGDYGGRLPGGRGQAGDDAADLEKQLQLEQLMRSAGQLEYQPGWDPSQQELDQRMQEHYVNMQPPQPQPGTRPFVGAYGRERVPRESQQAKMAQYRNDPSQPLPKLARGYEDTELDIMNAQQQPDWDRLMTDYRQQLGGHKMAGYGGAIANDYAWGDRNDLGDWTDPELKATPEWQAAQRRLRNASDSRDQSYEQRRAAEDASRQGLLDLVNKQLFGSPAMQDAARGGRYRK